MGTSGIPYNIELLHKIGTNGTNSNAYMKELKWNSKATEDLAMNFTVYRLKMILNKDYQQKGFLTDNRYSINLNVTPFINKYNINLTPFTTQLKMTLELEKKKITPQIGWDLSNVATTDDPAVANYERVVVTPYEALLMEADKESGVGNSFMVRDAASKIDVAKSYQKYLESRLFDSEKFIDNYKGMIKDKVLQDYIFYLAIHLETDLSSNGLIPSGSAWLPDISNLLNASTGTLNNQGELPTLFGDMGSDFNKNANLFKLMVEKYNNKKNSNGSDKVDSEKINSVSDMFNTTGVTEDLKLVTTGFMKLMSQVTDKFS